MLCNPFKTVILHSCPPWVARSHSNSKESGRQTQRWSAVNRFCVTTVHMRPLRKPQWVQWRRARRTHAAECVRFPTCPIHLFGPFQSYVAFLAKKDTKPVAQLYSLPCWIFVSEKMFTIYTLSRSWTFQKILIRLTLFLLRLCKGSGFSKMKFRGIFVLFRKP